MKLILLLAIFGLAYAMNEFLINEEQEGSSQQSSVVPSVAPINVPEESTPAQSHTPASTNIPEESVIPAQSRAPATTSIPEKSIVPSSQSNAPATTNIPEESVIPSLSTTRKVPVATNEPAEPTGPVPAVVYTIYGRSTCPDTEGTELVYDGLVAKASWKETGGGVDYQCLSKEPQYLEYKEGIQTSREYIMGVEYEDWEGGPFSSVHTQGVPCAVCYTSARSVSIMIPGRYQCPLSWTVEYYGYLAAERWEHPSPSTYACVDASREVVPNSSTNTEGGTMMPVETYCESHICPPYEKGKEFTCVVCSR